MHLKLNITNKDITLGEKANPANCAIARAIKRNRTVKTSCVSVFHDMCIIHAKKQGKIMSYSAPLPKVASDFIHRFDHSKAVSPVSFCIDLHKSRQTDLYSVK